MSTLTLRITGFLGSLLLTFMAYVVIVSPQLFGLMPQGAVGVILALAVCQAALQVVFFLDITHEKGTRWNFLVFISTMSIIFIIVAFSIWIMHHLNYNMMPWMH